MWFVWFCLDVWLLVIFVVWLWCCVWYFYDGVCWNCDIDWDFWLLCEILCVVFDEVCIVVWVDVGKLCSFEVVSVVGRSCDGDVYVFYCFSYCLVCCLLWKCVVWWWSCEVLFCGECCSWCWLFCRGVFWFICDVWVDVL